MFDRHGQFFQEPRIERVHRLRPIDRDHGEPIFHLDLDEIGHVLRNRNARNCDEPSGSDEADTRAKPNTYTVSEPYRERRREFVSHRAFILGLALVMVVGFLLTAGAARAGIDSPAGTNVNLWLNEGTA